MLTLTLDGYDVDLPPDAEVALSYRSSDLRRLDTREASFSETFTLPRTARNANVLQHAHALSSQTTTPYRRLAAVLRANGVPVLQGVAVLEASTQGYEVTLLDDTADLFGRVGEANLRELDLSAYDHLRALPDVQVASNDNPARGYVYALSDTGRLANLPAFGPDISPDATTRILYWEQPPAVYESLLLRLIVARALPGFTLTGSLLTDALFQKCVLPAVYAVPRLRESYLAPYRIQAAVETDTLYEIPSVPFDPEGLELAFPVLASGEAAHFVSNARYTPPSHLVQVEVKGRLLVQNDGYKKYLALHAVNDPDPLSSIWQQEVTFNYAGVVTFDVTLPVFLVDAAGPLVLRINDFPNGSATPPGDPFIRFTLLAGSTVTWAIAPYALTGAPVHLETSLPDLSQAEYLKLLANRFNVTFATDAATQTVRIDLFNELERRRPEAPDWSGKFDYSQVPRLDYRLPDYAQHNVFRYDDAPKAYAPLIGQLTPEQAAAQVGSAFLSVPDLTLPPTRDAYVAPVVLPEDRRLSGAGSPVAWLPLSNDEDQDALAYIGGATYRQGERASYFGRTWTSTLAEPGPALLPGNLDQEDWTADSLDTETATVAVLVPLLTAPAVSADWPATDSYTPTWGLSRAGLSFAELLPAYHEGTARMLARVQLLTHAYTLNAVDIAALDFSRPVRLNVRHIDGYGDIQGLFYVNIVDKHRPGLAGTTQVELIRLGDPVPGLAPAALPLAQRPAYPLLLETGGFIQNEPETAVFIQEQGL